MADTSAADTIAGAPCADVTSVVPEVTQAAAVELAWSVEDTSAVLSHTWHETGRWALSMILVGLALAGAVVVERPAPATAPISASQMSAPVLPEPDEPPDAATSATIPPFAPPPVADAGHLRPPPASNIDRDAMFLGMLRSYGLTITDANMATADAQRTCAMVGRGYSGAEVARMYMSGNASLRSIDAANIVFAAVSVYCPQFTSSLVR
ncbi:hypothetical protein DSM43518_02003 [Mycobacterium marinum]|uniref:DUF732 domain-containing protein n=1 Tax=Mycobacterium marinum TaxID=1781 RepID=UPI000E3BCD58|nr:DUF732 domain-containing protein [Mycobacterium marinum]RFZ11163.1 hypothetical protein DSM43518_02003 [Mycobacterium marinum]